MQIVRLSTAVPQSEYSTEELMKQFPCELREPVAQNIHNLGVIKRHLIDHPCFTGKGETPMKETALTDLCCQACDKVIREADLHPKDVDCFVSSYDANPFLSPGLSQLLIPKLGLNPFVRYVNVQGIASTAFTKTLQVAGDYLAAKPRGKVLICVSGVSSFWFQNQVRGLKDVAEIAKIGKIEDSRHRQAELRKWVATLQFFLFGDGVAAAIVSNMEGGLRVGQIEEVTNVDEKDYLAGYTRLTCFDEPFKFGIQSHLGKEIPDLGVKYTSLIIDRIFGDKHKNRIDSAKKWAVHTGSEKILDALAEHHRVEKEKVEESHYVLRNNGNLAGASLPFIIERITSISNLSRGDRILMLAYGWGFSASAGLLDVQESFR